jgi:hypothetical protein
MSTFWLNSLPPSSGLKRVGSEICLYWHATKTCHWTVEERLSKGARSEPIGRNGTYKEHVGLSSQMGRWNSAREKVLSGIYVCVSRNLFCSLTYIVYKIVPEPTHYSPENGHNMCFKDPQDCSFSSQRHENLKNYKFFMFGKLKQIGETVVVYCANTNTLFSSYIT